MSGEGWAASVSSGGEKSTNGELPVAAVAGFFSAIDIDIETGMPCSTEWNFIMQELLTCQRSLDPATLLDPITQELQDLKKQHSAELQQAREQAPLQAVCMVLRESKRTDFAPMNKQTGGLCC